MSEVNLEVLQFIYQKAQEHGAAVEWGQQMAKMGTFHQVYGNVPFPLWLSTVQSRMAPDMLLPPAAEPVSAATPQQQIVTVPAQQMAAGVGLPIDLNSQGETYQSPYRNNSQSETYQAPYDSTQHTHPYPTPNTHTPTPTPTPTYKGYTPSLVEIGQIDQHAWRAVLFRLAFLSGVAIFVFFLIRGDVFNKLAVQLQRIRTHSVPAQSATPSPTPPAPSPSPSSPDSIMNGQQPPVSTPNPHAPANQPPVGSEGTEASPSPGMVDRLEQVKPLLEGAVAK